MKDSPLSLAVIGSGGFASELRWLIDDINIAAPNTWRIECFVSADTPPKNACFEGIPLVGETALASGDIKTSRFIVAIGDNSLRKRISSKLCKNGLEPATLIHPDVTIGQNVRIGAGSIVLPKAILAPHSNIAEFAIINTSATIGHHCTIESFVNICPGARLGGASFVGEGALVGSNAVLHPKARMESWSSLGPCSYLIKTAPADSSWIGVPARRFS